VVCLATGLLMAGFDRLFPTPRLLPPGAGALGWLPVAIALGLGGWSIRSFHRAETTPHPWGDPRALVVSGPYRFSRNPMYLALLLLLVGWWIALGTPAALIGLPIFVIAVDRLFIRREERLLEARFGAAFGAFRQRVRRWI
jgi:Putative protein-S-isoprenylcysteine methyltransferase